MERENPLKFMACAATVLVAGIAFSTPQVDDFEDGNVGEAAAGWTGGGGTIATGTPTEPDCGFPNGISNHSKVLSVSGEATRASGIDSPAAQGQADFMVNITEASDASTFTEAMDSNVQIAVAAGSTITAPVSPATLGTVPLRIYCKPKSGSAFGAVGWIDGPSVTTGVWHRVSLVFDYASRLCKVSVDGKPYVSSLGFLKADRSSDTDKNGAWYGLANNPTYDKITSLSFVGAAKVDDVVIDAASTVTETYSLGPSSVTVDGLPVSYVDLNKWGVDSDTIGGVYLDNSGLSVAQKVVAGLDPTDGSTFTAKAMKMTSATTATITLPGGIKEGRTYTVNYTTDGITEVEATTSVNDGVLTVNDLPADAKVLTFRVSVKATASQSGN